MNMKMYKQMEEVFIKETDLKVGDTVKVTRVGKTGELGWDVYWNSQMVADKELKIKGFLTNGIELSDEYVYPFFVLEKVIPPLPANIPLNTYEVKFNDDGSIKVGCESITFEKLEKIYKTAKSLI